MRKTIHDRPCARCEKRGHLLHKGQLYCARCFPAHELEHLDRYAFVVERCSDIREEIERQRRERRP